MEKNIPLLVYVTILITSTVTFGYLAYIKNSFLWSLLTVITFSMLLTMLITKSTYLRCKKCGHAWKREAEF